MSIDTFTTESGTVLSVNDVIKLMAKLDAAKKAQRKEGSKRRVAARAFLTRIVPGVIAEFPMGVMGDKGVIGTSLGGTIEIDDPATGEKREARVTLSVRWLDTIPAREKKDADAEDAAEDAADTTFDVDVAHRA